MTAPRKRLEIAINLSAYDWDHVDTILRQIRTDLYVGDMRGGGTSGDGWSIDVNEDETAPAEEEFMRLLSEWVEALRAERRAERESSHPTP